MTADYLKAQIRRPLIVFATHDAVSCRLPTGAVFPFSALTQLVFGRVPEAWR